MAPAQERDTRLLIVSSDCHGGLPTEAYRDLFDPPYREAFDDYMRATETFRAERRARLERFGIGDDRTGFSAALDADVRLKQLEADGVAAEVIFPDGAAENQVPFTGMFGNKAKEFSPELLRAGQRAYNRWLADFVDPSRQAGLALISTHDADAAVTEIQWAAAHGLRGLLFDGVLGDQPPPNDPHWDPIWSAVEDVDLAVHYHGGAGSADVQTPPSLTQLGGGVLSTVGTHEIQFWSHRPLWYLLHTGVFERHPRVRVIFTEVFADWIPRNLRWADWLWELNRQRYGDELLAVVPRRPSEYWHDHCAVGASVMCRAELELREELGVENMQFGTDYPHPEGTWGHTLEFLQATFGTLGVSERDSRAILGENAARFYRFDRAVLDAVAERCGPTVDEVLNTPIADDDLPPDLRIFVQRPEVGV